MLKYLKTVGVLLLLPTLLGCTNINYAPGEAPPLMCRGPNQWWSLVRRDNTHTSRWYVAGEHRWSDWVAGQVLESASYGPVITRLKNWGRDISLYVEDAAGKQISRPGLFRRVRECVYVDDTGLLALYARHALRDDVLIEFTY